MISHNGSPSGRLFPTFAGRRTMPLICLVRVTARQFRRASALTLAFVLAATSAHAGVTITQGSGIAITGADGVTYVGSNVLGLAGADGLLAFGVNGISAPGSNGIAITGADGFTYLGSNGITATGVNGLNLARAAGITVTGPNGIAITGADGTTYYADSVALRQANGVVATGADRVSATGVDGITSVTPGFLNIAYSDGLAANGIDGIAITGADGIAITGADGRVFTIAPSGIAITGADQLIAVGPSGIAITGADGIVSTGSDTLATIGSLAGNIAHADGLTAAGADRIALDRADSMTIAALRGMTITGANGSYQASSIFLQQPRGVTATGPDGITAAGVDGITPVGNDGLQIANLNGLTATGVTGIAITGADGIAITGADGRVFSISSNGITITGADGLNAVGATGVTMTGVRDLAATGVLNTVSTGLQSVDPELALLLNRLTDDSSINAAIVYHHLTTDADIANLQRIGILGGTRFRALPVIILTATRAQLVAISSLPAVRAIYGNRTLPTLLEPGNHLTGTERVKSDSELTARDGGIPYDGRGVTVAVLDTGLDATHADLAGRVVQNVMLASTMGVGAGFNYPLDVTALPNTDLVAGHGTFVAGVIAGSGAASGGKYKGVAPGSRLVGLSAGQLDLFYVLEGFDYLLARGPGLGVRVVNCSFSASTAYDPNDPVNVATKMLVERGISVVFSAGNTGPGTSTLNPYAMAPWVISVGATDERGRLADFSSRGAFGNIARPTIVAPGVNVVSLRGTGLGLTMLLGGSLVADPQRLSLFELPYYTTGSGTSFSAPQVVGTIALMLQANPLLTPGHIRDILQRSATLMPPAYSHEVGAGMLNAHAAVLEAAFPQRRMGVFRATLDRTRIRFINDPYQEFTGTVQPGTVWQTGLSIPNNVLLAAVRIAWGPPLTGSDLGLTFVDPGGTVRAESNSLNVPGLTGKHENVAVDQPVAGQWSARVSNTFGLSLTAQPFSGVLEMTHVEYPALADLSGLNATAQAEVYQNLRSFVMWASGQHFRPQFSVSRLDLAAALVLGARVPQYLPAQSHYSDVGDQATMLMVESVQAAPMGAAFPDTATGSRFRPDDPVDRLTAAIALVRAAGLRAAAEKQAGALLPCTDTSSVPTQYRGYVAVALSNGLLIADGLSFRPASALTRAELSHAMVTVTSLALQ
jgi:serine protease AprX